MNDKESNVPVYLAIIFAISLVVGAGYYFLGKPAQVKTNKTTPTPTVIPVIPTPTPNVTVTVTVTSTPKGDSIKCELCHANPQDLKPHVNGGKLCINCHGSQVHSIHIGAGTVNLQCETCHGFPPKIPTVQKGEGPGSYSVCEQCHAAPPDSLKPSNGSLIVIHLSRGKYCTNCHGTDIGAIHAPVISNATNKSK